MRRLVFRAAVWSGLLFVLAQESASAFLWIGRHVPQEWWGLATWTGLSAGLGVAVWSALGLVFGWEG